MTYSVTESDIAAFAMYQARNRSETRRSRWVSTLFVLWSVPLLGLALGVVVSGAASITARSFVIAMAVGVAMAAYFYTTYPRLVAKRVTRIYAREPSPSALGTHTLMLDANGVTVTNERERSQLSWTAIVRVAATDSHLFAFLGPLQALVIPRATLNGASFEGLVSEFRSRVQPAA